MRQQTYRKKWIAMHISKKRNILKTLGIKPEFAGLRWNDLPKQVKDILNDAYKNGMR